MLVRCIVSHLIGGLDAFLAVLIVELPFLLIGQRRVGFRNLLKVLGRFLTVRILVRVPLRTRERSIEYIIVSFSRRIIGSESPRDCSWRSGRVLKSFAKRTYFDGQLPVRFLQIGIAGAPWDSEDLIVVARFQIGSHTGPVDCSPWP